jgi:hypothetical protein
MGHAALNDGMLDAKKVADSRFEHSLGFLSLPSFPES